MDACLSTTKQDSENTKENDIDIASRLESNLSEHREHEYFEKANTKYALENPRYSGICGSLGNAVFSDTPVQPPCYTKARKKPCTLLPGYNQQVNQHPLYTTTSSEYGGLIPSRANLPNVFFPQSESFTNRQKIGGNYEDSHLTTETDKVFRGH